MIRFSDNEAATSIYSHVGDQGLRELAAWAQLEDFRVRDSWGNAQITAADQARFFAHLDDFTPPEYESFVPTCCPRLLPSRRGASPRSRANSGKHSSKAAGLWTNAATSSTKWPDWSRESARSP